MNEEPKSGDAWKAGIRVLAVSLILLGVVFLIVGAVQGDGIVGSGSGGCVFWPLPVIFACGVGWDSVQVFVLLFLAATAGLVVFQVFLMWWGRRSTNAD